LPAFLICIERSAGLALVRFLRQNLAQALDGCGFSPLTSQRIEPCSVFEEF